MNYSFEEIDHNLSNDYLMVNILVISDFSLFYMRLLYTSLCILALLYSQYFPRKKNDSELLGQQA